MARPGRAQWNGEASYFAAAVGTRATWWEYSEDAPPEAIARLAAVAPGYRVDRLLELGADLHDCLHAYRAGRVGPTTLREAALAVAVEAALLYLVETERGERE